MNFILFFSLFVQCRSLTVVPTIEPSNKPSSSTTNKQTFHPYISSTMPVNPPRTIPMNPVASQPTYTPVSVAPTLSYAMEVTAVVN